MYTHMLICAGTLELQYSSWLLHVQIKSSLFAFARQLVLRNFPYSVLLPQTNKVRENMRKYGLDGKRVRRLREDIGLSQGELTARLPQFGQNISQSHVSSLERGLRSVSVEVLIAIAFALDTTTDYLAGLTDDPAPRSDLEEQVILVEHDPVRREYLQRMLTSIERMPSAQRDEYWHLLGVMYNGIVSQERSLKANGYYTRM